MAYRKKNNVLKTPAPSPRFMTFAFNCNGSGAPGSVSGSNYSVSRTDTGAYTVALSGNFTGGTQILAAGCNMHINLHTDATDPPVANIGSISGSAGTIHILTHVAGTLADVTAASGSVHGWVMIRDTDRTF